MMYKLVGVLFLVGLVAGEDKLIINDYIDYILNSANKWTTEEMGVTEIPSVPLSGLELKNGRVFGLNSLRRIGDAWLALSGNSRGQIDVRVGLRLLALAFGSVKIDGEETSGLFTVRNNSFHLVATGVQDETGNFCNVTLDKFEWDVLTDVSLESSDPAYDEDVSEEFTKEVLPYVNKQFLPLKLYLQYLYDMQICKDHNNSENSVASFGIELLKDLLKQNPTKEQ